MAGGAGIAFERLSFPHGASLSDSRDVTFKNCTFSGRTDGLKADEVKNLKVIHSVFADAAVNVENGSGVFLSGNIYANDNKPAVSLDAASAIRYSDYNSYQDKAQCWKVNGAALSLARLQKKHDRYSRALSPQFAMNGGVPRLKNDNRFRSVGPNDTALGIHHEYVATATPLKMVGPFMHSVSDTTANIEWWTTKPAAFELAWGETPKLKRGRHSFRGTTRFNTYSLTGLKPGKKYYFRIFSANASRRNVSMPVLEPKNAIVSFKTARKAASPRSYYVAPDGDDANDGLSRGEAFKTVCRAAARVGPGDTVMIAAGDYNETVRIRAAGTKDRPITFRCIKGEKAVIRGENLERSFEVIAKPDNRFDGLYFRGQSFWREGFVVRQSPRVLITRCLNTMVSASQSPGMVIRNCVLRGGWNAVAMSSCDGSVVENNVCIMTILRQLNCSSRILARRNIFCECIRNKGHQTLLQLSEDVTESDNCFYVRWPEDEKLAVNNLPLPQYRARTGSNSFAANPMMPGTPGWGQGWQKSSDEDFDKFFSTNPKLILRDIGLQPEAFSDFHLTVPEWPYTRAWAKAFTEASEAASALARAGKDTAALAAYTGIVKQFPLSDRLKSDVLERASLCAERLQKYDRAMQLAKEIPVAPISMHRQMQLMLKQKQYAALLAAFNQKKLGGRSFHLSYMYPEREDVMADLYYYRSLAYVHTGDLAAAEADLRIMNDKASKLSYTSGEAIHGLAALRLGDFYRTQLKDDKRALAEYLKVCGPQSWNRYPAIPKLVLTGATDTLAKATKAACEILRKQSKLNEVEKLQSSLVKAQADAKAALRKK